jgi:NADH dehydrogenase/NADH:ubiquinone oxidoreductase subunit G
VNDYWMCDPGRLGYKAVHEGRLFGGWIGGRGERGSYEAMDAFVETLSSARPADIGFVASPDLSVEELLAVKRFAALFAGARLAGGSLRAPWVDDGILRKADRHPNTRGLEMLGLAGGLSDMLAQPPRVLVVFQEDLAGDGGDAVRAALRRAERLLVVCTHRTATVEMAHAALPASTYAETEGSYVNFEGRLQRFLRALEPLGESRPLVTLLAELSGRLGLPIGWTAEQAGPEVVWSIAAEAEPALRGIAYGDVPREGMPLGPGAPQSVAAAAAARTGPA